MPFSANTISNIKFEQATKELNDRLVVDFRWERVHQATTVDRIVYFDMATFLICGTVKFLCPMRTSLWITTKICTSSSHIRLYMYLFWVYPIICVPFLAISVYMCTFSDYIRLYVYFSDHILLYVYLFWPYPIICIPFLVISNYVYTFSGHTLLYVPHVVTNSKHMCVSLFITQLLQLYCKYLKEMSGDETLWLHDQQMTTTKVVFSTRHDQQKTQFVLMITSK